MVCRLNTYIGLDRMAKNDYTVYRRYKVRCAYIDGVIMMCRRQDFLLLDAKLRERYRATGTILPPPPGKNRVKGVHSRLAGDKVDTEGVGRDVGG